MKRFLLLQLFVLLAGILHAQNFWHPVSSPTDVIHWVSEINDTLYGNEYTTQGWTIKRQQNGIWFTMPTIPVDSAEWPKNILRFQGDLYALTATDLYRFSNGQWQSVVNGTDFLFQTVYKNKIIIIGDYWSINGQTAYGFATYDGTTIEPLKDHNGQTAWLWGTKFYAMEYNNKLYVTGDLQYSSNGSISCNMQVWNDSVWADAFPGGTYFGPIGIMAELNGELYFHMSPLPSSGMPVFKLQGGNISQISTLAPGLSLTTGLGGVGTTIGLTNHNNQLWCISQVNDSTSSGVVQSRYTLLRHNGTHWQDQQDSLTVNWTGALYLMPLYYESYIQWLTSANGYLHAWGIKQTPSPGFVYVKDSTSVTLSLATVETNTGICVIDSAKRYLQNELTITNNNGFTKISTSANGPRLLDLPIGTNSTLQIGYDKTTYPYHTVQMCSDTLVNLNLATSSTQPVHFYLDPSVPAYDVAVKSVTGQFGWRCRSGFNQNYFVKVSNVGTLDLPAVSVDVAYPMQSQFLVSNLLPDSTQAGHVFFTLDSLPVGQERTILVKIQNPTTLPLWDTVSYTATALIANADSNLANNSFTLEQLVTAAYDPNNKLVSPEMLKTWGGEAKYHINFQNLGNDTAFKVVIIDTLPAEVYPETFRFISASHPVNYRLDSNLLVFEFNNILLPDSATDADGSMGYVQFALDMDDQLAQTDTIKNRAFIYFDFQPAVITNYAKTFYSPDIGGFEHSTKSLHIYPNPTTGIFRVTSPQKAEFAVYNQFGQSVWSGLLQANEEQVLDLSHLPNGIYMIRSDSGWAEKIIIQR